jgi:hypothetical protein
MNQQILVLTQRNGSNSKAETVLINKTVWPKKKLRDRQNYVIKWP